MVTVRLPRSGPAAGLPEDAELGDVVAFAHPAEASDGNDSRVFTACATTKLELKLDASEVTRLTRSRRHTYTLFVRAGDAATEFLARLDDHVVRVVKANVRSWFEHQMNKNLVDEYYRRSTELNERGRVLCRFVFVSDAPPPDAIEVGSSARLTLQLVGLQFRQQYFTAVWRLAGARQQQQGHPGAADGDRERPEAPPSPTASVAASEQVGGSRRKHRASAHPPQQAQAQAAFGAYRFHEDARDASDAQDDDEYIGPSAEERDGLRASLLGRLVQLEQNQQTRLDDVRDMLATFSRSAAGEDDLGVIAELEDRLEQRLHLGPA